MVNIGDEIEADDWVGSPSLKSKLSSLYSTLGLNRNGSCGVDWQEWDSINGEDTYGESADKITVSQMEEMRDRIIFAWENRCATHNNQVKSTVENTNNEDEKSSYNLDVEASDNETYRLEHCHVADTTENIIYRVSVDTGDNETYLQPVEYSENVNEHIGENGIYDGAEKISDNGTAKTTDFLTNYESHEENYDLDCTSHKDSERFGYDLTDNSPHYSFAWASVNSPEYSSANPSHLGTDFDGDKITYNNSVYDSCAVDCTGTNISNNTGTEVTYRSTHRGVNNSTVNFSQDFNDNTGYDTGTVSSYDSSTVSGYESSYKLSFNFIN